MVTGWQRMNLNIQTAHQKPAPTTGIRLVLWFGIYFAAQVPMIFRLGSDYSPLNIVLFPSVLGMVVAIPLNMMPDAISQVLAGILLPAGFVVGYIVYPLHLVVTLWAQTRRRFSFLLLELVAITLMNESIFWGMMNCITL